MKILVLNGPNINMLGIREPWIYGSFSYDELVREIEEYSLKRGVETEIYQSNHEGDMVDAIQRAFFEHTDAIIINPAAYTHTSIAILDALKAVCIPTVEVHLSDINKREGFRRLSYIRDVALKSISGKGIKGYLEAIDYLLDHRDDKEPLFKA